MLHELMASHRDELLALAKDRISRQRPASTAIVAVRNANLPAFLEAVIEGIRRPPAEGADAREVPHVPGELVQFDIDELVHEYGSLCYSTLELAHRTGAPISMREHQALNQSLDRCIARTVIEWEEAKRRGAAEPAVRGLGLLAPPRRKAPRPPPFSFRAARAGPAPRPTPA